MASLTALIVKFDDMLMLLIYFYIIIDVDNEKVNPLKISQKSHLTALELLVQLIQ